MGNLQLEKERDAVKIARDLALERGDINRETQQAVPFELKEKNIIKAAEEPSLENQASTDGHLMLEGYKVKSGERQPTPMATEGV